MHCQKSEQVGLRNVWFVKEFEEGQNDYDDVEIIGNTK